MGSSKILFVDDEKHLRKAVSQTFNLAGMDITCFDDAREALEHVSRDFDGILITDIRMPEMTGTQLLNHTLEIDYDLPVVLVTGHGDIQMAVEAMRNGAYDFIEKPFTPSHLVEVARRALEKRRLTIENRKLRASLANDDVLERRLSGRTDVMKELRNAVRSIADTDVNVLVNGDTGCGKEVTARSIHDLGNRRDKAFVVINCAAIPQDRIEVELFGHEQGAFPGALKERFGKLEHARGGTIFLDHLESASTDLQAKLLRVVEDRVFYRLGSNEPVTLDVRFISASQENLAKLVESKKFREDLFHLINTISIRVPELSERKEDIPGLFLQLVNEAAIKYRREFLAVPPETMSLLVSREWPGNVRELKNVADRYVLGFNLQDMGSILPGPAGGTLAERATAFEREVIIAELAAHKGVLRKTYEALGLSRKSLYEKMQKHDLSKNDYKVETNE